MNNNNDDNNDDNSELETCNYVQHGYIIPDRYSPTCQDCGICSCFRSDDDLIASLHVIFQEDKEIIVCPKCAEACAQTELATFVLMDPTYTCSICQSDISLKITDNKTPCIDVNNYSSRYVPLPRR